jgi:hypothetical protein
MKKILSTLCLTTLVSFALVSCEKESSMLEPTGPQKSDANAKNHKVTICHREGNGGSHTITIAMAAWQAHQKHGDSMGACAYNPTPD